MSNTQQPPESTIEPTMTDANAEPTSKESSCGGCGGCKDAHSNQIQEPAFFVKERNSSIMGMVLKGAAATVRARKYPAFREYIIASIQALGNKSYSDAVAIADKLFKDLTDKESPLSVWMRYVIISKVHNAKVRKLLKSLTSKQVKPLKYDLSEADAYLWSTILESAAKDDGFSLLDIIDKIFTSNSVLDGLRVLKEDGVDGIVKFLRDMEAKGQVSVTKVTGADLKELFKRCCKPETPDSADSSAGAAASTEATADGGMTITATTKPETNGTV